VISFGTAEFKYSIKSISDDTLEFHLRSMKWFYPEKIPVYFHPHSQLEI
jgi:hypothetical protein